jgi:tRNA pseudouridine32 synthase/23S rRNA pseudouridine746 synthase
MPRMVRSRLYLPKTASSPGTVLDHLAERFPHVPYAVWKERFERGRVTARDGGALAADAAYRHGLTVYYERETPGEPEPAEVERIVHRDDRILVVDKPHGMPVTPTGDYVARALIVRLRSDLGLPGLTPSHRLDRETAGLVLLCADPAMRARYHGLFAAQAIEREYLAVAHWREAVGRGPWVVENRIVPGDPWFLQCAVEGPANAATEIELIETHREKGLFRLLPRTGKKHQLRVHMASIGAPIVGDAYYGDRSASPASLQLLARRLSFVDPVTGVTLAFASSMQVAWP